MRIFNKSGEEVFLDNLVLIMLLVIFSSGMLYFINSQKAGVGAWSDFYSKEIAKLVDMSSPGQSIRLNVHKATEIAKSNKMSSFDKIFYFDNVKKEICVTLSSRAKQSCYGYFSDYEIINSRMELASSENYLVFDITRRKDAKI